MGLGENIKLLEFFIFFLSWYAMHIFIIVARHFDVGMGFEGM